MLSHMHERWSPDIHLGCFAERQLPGRSSFILGRKAWERWKELELFQEWLWIREQ